MDIQHLQTMARYLAGRQMAEGGKEAVILDRLKSSAGHLQRLFQEWKIDFAGQERMLQVCLGFKPRAALGELGQPSLPSHPAALVHFLTSNPVLFYRRSATEAVIGTSDPMVAAVAGQLSLLAGTSVELAYLTAEEIARGRERLGPALETASVARAEASVTAAQELDEQSGPVVQLVDLILQEAVRRKASDIHVEPYETNGLVRYRLDGVLVKAREYAIELHRAITSRLKVLAGMDISERRLPQDGRFRYEDQGVSLDLRVASFPSAHGEAVSLRLLTRSALRVELESGGFRPQVLARLRDTFAATQGIVLVTGPTGAGKTTTLYGVIRELNKGDTRIVTIEDPIEYELYGVVQVQVNPKVGLTFAAGLRAFLRGDPDIISVGEIRDQETADIAIKAALTGHLVLATVHTNSAAGTLTRLVDMGFEAYNLSATIQAILAQRLCRKVCARCATEVACDEGTAELFRANGLEPPQRLAEAAGCDACFGLGYRDRMGVHELLVMDDDLRHAVNRSASEQELEAIAAKNGMKTLMQDGLLKVAERQTTIAELLRVLGGVADEGSAR